MLTSASLSVGTRSIVALSRVMGDMITRFFSDMLPMVSGVENLMVSCSAIFGQSDYNRSREWSLEPLLSHGGVLLACGAAGSVVSPRSKDSSFSLRCCLRESAPACMQMTHKAFHLYKTNTTCCITQSDWPRLAFRCRPRGPHSFFIVHIAGQQSYRVATNGVQALL